jgi:hypothetical protein
MVVSSLQLLHQTLDSSSFFVLGAIFAHSFAAGSMKLGIDSTAMGLMFGLRQ